MSQVHFDLAALVRAHGTRVILDALRDACDNASSFTHSLGTGETSAAWDIASHAMADVCRLVVEAEGGASVDLESSLMVLDDTTAADDGEPVRPVDASPRTDAAFVVIADSFVDAAMSLDVAWSDVGNDASYPDYLPSFDEFVSDMTAWKHAVAAKVAR